MAKTKPACRYAAWIDFRTGPAGCEKICTASLLSKPVSLLGKFPGFEGNRETREMPKCGSGSTGTPEFHKGGYDMRKELLAALLGSTAVFAASGALANDELVKLQQDAKQWVMPAGDYANTRYS